MPAISRTLRRDGIVFEHLRYWHPIFSQWLARRERLSLHFDPRNLSKLYVPHEGDYLEVPFSDLRMPPVSLWEVQAATRHLRKAGQKSINPALLVEAIDKQREIVRAAQAKTRKMRRKQQLAHRTASGGIDPLNDAVAPAPKSDIDWSKPAVPFEGEFGAVAVVRRIAMPALDISPPKPAPSPNLTTIDALPTCRRSLDRLPASTRCPPRA